MPGAFITEHPPASIPAEPAARTRVLTVSSQDDLPTDLLDRFPRLQAVVTRSTGCDRLPLARMHEQGIHAYHLNGYATESVAQHTLMLILALLRRLPEASGVTKGWDPVRPGPPRWDRSMLQGRNLDEVTIGVLGTGRIGSRMVRLLSALGATTRGYDIAPDSSLDRVAGFAYVESLQTLLRTSDVLTIHVPLTPQTHALIARDELRQLPAGALVVNTARGAIVDQEAVAGCLDNQSLSGYAADVLPGEPEPGDLDRFHGFTNVVLTPHLAAYDGHALRSRYETTARVAGWVLAGDEDALGPYRAYLP